MNWSSPLRRAIARLAPSRASILIAPIHPRRYLAAFGTSLAGLVACFFAGLAILASIDRLPSPPVTGTFCIDAKFNWLRENRKALHAGIVAVGSSVTWRNIDFSALSAAERGAAGGVLNAAPCFLMANQTAHLARFLVNHQPEIHTVLTVVAPRDFEKCSSVPTAFFDRKIAGSFLYGALSPWWLHFRNFRPYEFLRSVKHLPQWRDTVLRFDRFGSGPIVEEEPQMWGPTAPEPECFAELTSLADDLSAAGRRFVVVVFPAMPAWVERHGLHAMIDNFSQQVSDALAGTDAVLVDTRSTFPVATEDFVDPAHLQWPRTAPFTRYVFEHIGGVPRRPM